MMKVLVSIDPPWPKRCYENSRGTDIGPRCRYYGGLGCRLGFNSPRNGERPTACIDAESVAAKLAEDAELACENRVHLCDVEGCDAEVTCGWPTGGGYRQTCSRHHIDGLSFMAAPRQPERDRVTDALAAVLCGEVHSAGDRQA